VSIRWRDRIEHLYRLASAQPGSIPLGGGFPAPHLFPSDALADSSSRVLHRLGRQVLQYDWPEGREDLRGWIAERLRRRGADVAPEDVLVTSGAQQALAIAADPEDIGEQNEIVAVREELEAVPEGERLKYISRHVIEVRRRYFPGIPDDPG
jgi:hypothetical protein